MSAPERWSGQPPLHPARMPPSSLQGRPFSQPAAFSSLHSQPPEGYHTNRPYLQPHPEPARGGHHEQKRIRISRACDPCRRKKIKCDAAAPGSVCKNCLMAKITCTFNDSAKKRGPPKGYIELLETRLRRMERLLGGSADEDGNGSETCDTEEEENHRVEETGPSLSNTPSLLLPADSSHTKSNEPQESLALELSSVSGEMRTRYIGDMSPLPYLAQKLNLENTSIASQLGMNVRRFGQTLILYEKDDPTGKGPNQRLLEHLGMLKPGESINGLNDWIYRVSGVDKAMSDRLLKVYFAYIHPGLPVINKSLFLRQYRREIGDYPSAPLLNAIYGAAARYIETCELFGDKTLSESDDKRTDIPNGWSEKLFDNLLVYVKGRYSPCIATIQALVIGQNHRASLEEKMTSGWLLNSAAIRMAQDLGLNRSSESWDIPDSEKETRRRVWWSVYILDKWSSAGTGRPQTIFDEDCDELYPSESASWEEVMDIPESSHADPGAEPRFPSLDKKVARKAKGEKIPLYQPFVQLVKLSEILGRVLQGLYTPRAKKHSALHGSDVVVSYLDKALSEWRAALPPALQISTANVRHLDSRGQTPLLSMSGLMYLSYCTLLILLHRPFIEREGGQKTRSSLSSLSICTSAATRCVDIADKMHYRDFMLVSWNFAIYPIFTASLIHIYNAANPDSIVSDVAKENLVKAARLIKRLSKLSYAAARLYEVLQKLMDARHISVDDPEALSDTAVDPQRPKKTSKRKGTKHPGAVCKKTSPGVDGVMGGGMGHRLSDVGRGLSPSQGECTDTAATTSVTTPRAPSDSDVGNSAGSTPSSIVNGDWINGLYSSLQPDATLATTSGGTTDQEPHSLRQFGLTEQMFAPLGPSHIDDMQPFNTLYAAGLVPPPPLQSAQSFLLGTPELGGSGTQQMHFSMAPTGAIPTSDIAQFPQDFPPLYGSSVAASSSTSTPALSQTLFRNRPDNPFWSVPSSIELDDWTAYLQPERCHANTGATTQASTNNQASATWSHSHGWV